MAIGTVIKTVISKSKRRRKNKETQQVVYKTHVANHKGKAIYASQTKHELV